MAIHVEIEGYDSFEQIAVGGMAAVYKARLISSGKFVAIKVLFPYLANDDSFIGRFQREAKAAAQLQHENIVNVIDSGESGGYYFIVMEYYEGVTLADLLEERPGIPLDVSLNVLLDVCRGLAAAHAKDIVHRDIKPANIIYTEDGGIKIADFGLAKKSDAITIVTQPGKVIGTPAYMSPEQAAGDPVGPQSDIFSLGVVAFEMLCRRRPFDGASYSDVLERIQTQEVPELTSENPLVHADVERIVARMLEKQPSHRYATITEVVTELENVMDQHDIKRGRGELQAYIDDPDVFDAAYRDRWVSRCLALGADYVRRGGSHLEEAILEFERILFLDPTNERAQKHLRELGAQHGNATTAVMAAGRRTLEDADTDAGSPGPVRVDPRTSPVRAAPRMGRRWVAPTAAVLGLAGIVSVAWWVWTELRQPPGNSAPVVSSPASMTVRAGETVDFTLSITDADGDSVRAYSDELPAGAELLPGGEFSWRVGDGQIGVHTLTFYADDGRATGTARTTVDVIGDVARSEPVQPPQVTVATAVARQPRGRVEWVLPKLADIYVDDTLKVREDTYLSIELPVGPHDVRADFLDGMTSISRSVEVEPNRRTTLEPPRLAYGRLSVYFLGGVGELFLNGERFGQQPPFTGAVLPVGEYTMGCRMFHEKDSRVFQVTVREGVDTIVEYEIGHEPTVMYNQADG